MSLNSKWSSLPFAPCAKGGVLLSVAGSILAGGASGSVASAITFLASWNALSWLTLLSYLHTKSEMEKKDTALTFILGTIVMTGGGWWGIVVLGWAMNKLNLSVIQLIMPAEANHESRL